MRLPNQRSCPLLPDHKFSVQNLEKALLSCTELFEESIMLGKPLAFLLSPSDLICLKVIYPKEELLAASKLALLMNEALANNQMPYGILRSFQAVDSTRFFAEPVRHQWPIAVKKKGWF
jgi:hypothetical protein